MRRVYLSDLLDRLQQRDPGHPRIDPNDRPSDGDAARRHHRQGMIHHDRGRLIAAIRRYRAALRRDPDLLAAHYNLASALHESGRHLAALPHDRAVLRAAPGHARTYNNLGTTLEALGLSAEALDCYRQALRLDPREAAAHGNLGQLLHRLGRLAAAREACQRALALRPDAPRLLANLAALWLTLGERERAGALWRQALASRPEDPEIRGQLLFLDHLDPDGTPAERLAAARVYGDLVARRARPFRSWPGTRDPDRPLRIGLVSGDLRRHPVGYFLERPLAALRAQASDRLTLHAYATAGWRDDLTERLRACCATWTGVAGWPDAELAARIHADRIDLLLDLAGHTAHTRLPVFAWQPAPVQVAWLGYFGTTGVAAMDYLLADPVGIPPAERGWYRERIWYLPDTRLCFNPPEEAPPVAPLPARQRPAAETWRFVFGCFQELAKLNDRVLALWGRILRARPEAGLRLQNRGLADPQARALFRQRLIRQGVPPRQVRLLGPAGRADYLAAHAEVDALLDTCPFPGGTTTCEALWMGVPTLTLTGPGLLARQGASLLTAAGLPTGDWVAEDARDYVARAIALGREARSLDRLAELRAGLRAQVARSALCDAPRFARELERAWRGMWRVHCQSRIS